MSDRRLSRQLKIFVSSTFNDMHGERNTLLEKVFPMAAEYGRKRKKEFIGVDLRWGVTEEQSRRGETVGICMAEIDRCRPLFMGMLGERYGWVPDGAECSVTEQEIRYGALEAPEGTEAFFYLRDPGLTEELCGPFEKDPRQEALKENIRESGYPVMDGYTDLDSFAERVLDDLKGAIDRLTEAEEEISPAEKYRREQRFTAEQYAAAYVDRPEDRERLEEKIRKGGLVLLTGEAGSGKTAMLARRALEAAPENGYTFLYFIGLAEDRGWEQLARQMTAELSARFGLEPPKDGDRETLRRAVWQALGMAARKGRVLLLLDQMDALALEDSFGLSWLPEELPENVCAVVTADEGEALKRLRRRSHAEIRLESLKPETVGEIARTYLAEHAKTLSDEQTALLTNSERARNPLYLITLLNEVRYTGRFETLTAQMEEYLECPGLGALFDKVLCRLDRDYDEEKNGLPGRMLQLLESSRGGLTEGELLPLLGGIPYARFAPLNLALRPFTALSGGAIHAANPEFSRAVRAHYGIGETEIQSSRREMAAWFDAHPESLRAREMLPWLLKETGASGRLAEVLSEPACFLDNWERNRYETRAYWAWLSGHGHDAAEAFRGAEERPEDFESRILSRLAEMLTELGENRAAEKILTYLTREGSPAEDAERILAYGLLGNLYQREGRLKEAEEYYRRKADLAEKTGDRYEQERAMGNIGLIAMMRGDPEEARAAFGHMLELAGTLNQRDAQQAALGNLGNIAFSLGENEEAERLYARQKNISLDSGNMAGLIHACGALGVLYLKTGRYAEAEAEFNEQERESRRTGAPEGLSTALGNRAVLARQQGDAALAGKLLKDKLEICRASGQMLGEQNALGNLAELAAEAGDIGGALKYAQERTELTRRGRALRQYAEALMALSGIEKGMGREDSARRHYLEAVSLAKQQGFPRSMEANRIRMEQLTAEAAKGEDRE